jgi:hypothetical protein
MFFSCMLELNDRRLLTKPVKPNPARLFGLELIATWLAQPVKQQGRRQPSQCIIAQIDSALQGSLFDLGSCCQG